MQTVRSDTVSGIRLTNESLGQMVVGGTELDISQNSQGNSEQMQKVVPFVVPFGQIQKPSTGLQEPQCTMLKTVIDAWQLMPEADRVIAYSLARRALGKPVLALPSNETNENT